MVSSDFKSVLRKRFKVLAAFVSAVWAIQALNWVMDNSLNPAFGLIPRQFTGLDGILAMPILHGSFAHLISNTPPLLLMGALLAATATRALLAVNTIIVILSGALVWLSGHARTCGSFTDHARCHATYGTALWFDHMGRASGPTGSILGSSLFWRPFRRYCCIHRPHACP